MFAKSNFSKKKFFGISALLLLTVSLAGVWAFFQLREWRHKELVAETRQALQTKDWEEAKFLLEVMRQRLPGREVTSKLTGDFFLYQNDPLAVTHRRHLAEHFPTAENRFAYGMTLLQFEQWKTAGDYLKTWAAEGTDLLARARYRGMFAYLRGDLAVAEKAFQKALDLDVNHAETRMNLAAIHLLSSDPEKQNQGRDTLKQGLKQEKTRKQAERILLETGILRDREDWILDSANSIWRNPSSSKTMRKQALEGMHAFSDKQWTGFFRDLENTGSLSLQHRKQILGVLNQLNRQPVIQSWIQLWQDFLRSHAELSSSLAEHYRKMGKWESLLHLLGDQNWGGEEFLRYAYIAHALEQSEQNRGPKQNFWMSAMEKANAQPENTLKLFQSLLLWEEEVGLAKMMANTPSHLRKATAWKEMELFYFQQYRPEAEWLESLREAMNPSNEDVVLKNNFAAVALSQEKYLPEAKALATEVFQAHPRNPDFATTYAMSIIDENPRRVVKILRSLLEQHPEHPGLKLWIGEALDRLGKINPFREEYPQLAAREHWLEREQAILKTWEMAVESPHLALSR